MADPVVHLTNGLPDSGTGNITTLGQTLLDGANVTQGALADAAVTAGATGSISAKLRSISRDIVANIVLAAGTAILGKVGVDQTTDGTTNKVAADVRLAGVAAATGSGVMGTGTQRVALATDSPGIITTGTAGTPSAVVLSVQGVASMTPINAGDPYGSYETVAASQTAQALGASGATGDYLAYVTVFPGTAGCGVVTILDNATTWGTFAGGGTTALPSLVPFRIDVGAFSTSGAWKITTGANVTCTGVGKFT